MLPTFDEATQQLTEFLSKCGYPQVILWRQPADILLMLNRVLYVKLPEVRSTFEYDDGGSPKLGVRLSAICDFGDASGCCVWAPRHKEEALDALIPADGSLKLSALAGESRIRGKRITNHFVRHLLTFLAQKRKHSVELLLT